MKAVLTYAYNYFPFFKMENLILKSTYFLVLIIYIGKLLWSQIWFFFKKRKKSNFHCNLYSSCRKTSL